MADTDPCQYDYEAVDSDGTQWYLCTTHNEMTMGTDVPCNGWRNPEVRAYTRRQMDEVVAENTGDLMSEVVTEGLQDVRAQAAVLTTLYEDRRPEQIRRLRARNTMISSVRRLGDWEFRVLWTEQLTDLVDLSQQIQRLYLRPKKRKKR